MNKIGIIKTKTMKKLLIVILLFATISCKKTDTEEPIDSTTQSQEEVIENGTVKINVSYTQTYSPGSCITNSVGIGYSSTDIANDAFFETSNYHMPHSYIFELEEGTYYYKVTTKCNCGNNPTCTNDGYSQSNLYTRYKNGSFTIVGGQEAVVNAYF